MASLSLKSSASVLRFSICAVVRERSSRRVGEHHVPFRRVNAIPKIERSAHACTQPTLREPGSRSGFLDMHHRVGGYVPHVGGLDWRPGGEDRRYTPGSDFNIGPDSSALATDRRRSPASEGTQSGSCLAFLRHFLRFLFVFFLLHFARAVARSPVGPVAGGAVVLGAEGGGGGGSGHESGIGGAGGVVLACQSAWKPLEHVSGPGEEPSAPIAMSLTELASSLEKTILVPSGRRRGRTRSRWGWRSDWSATSRRRPSPRCRGCQRDRSQTRSWSRRGSRWACCRPPCWPWSG